MSREIKFRGKSIDSRYSTEEYFLKMVYGQLINRYGDLYILMADGIEVQVNEKTVGQYIGLQDKNSKRIYEGDIVIVSTYSYEEPLIVTTCVVEYDDEYCLYNFTEIGAKGVYSYSMIEIRNSFKYELEAIGNKYENPELEGEK